MGKNKSDKLYDLYENDIVFRPPPEYNSVLLEVAVGCTYHKCGFCGCSRKGYDTFHMIDMERLERNTARLAEMPENRRRSSVFFLGSNVLALSVRNLLARFQLVHKYMPWIKRINMFARAVDVLCKSDAELLELKAQGMGMLYIGVESGSDKILKLCNKAETSKELLTCFFKLDSLGIPYGLSSITGLGGRELCRENATKTAWLYNQIHPRSIRVMTLTVLPGTLMDQLVKSGNFTLLTIKEEVLELRLMLEELNVDDCIFLATHPSNAMRIGGFLAEDKEMMTDKMDEFICTVDFSKLRKMNIAPGGRGW